MVGGLAGRGKGDHRLHGVSLGDPDLADPQVADEEPQQVETEEPQQDQRKEEPEAVPPVGRQPVGYVADQVHGRPILASATLRRTRQRTLPMPRPRLDPRSPLTELHVHLGAAVTPAIMWGIAHAQGIRLPTKDYWAFRDLITVGRRRRGFQAYLDLFHWTELIQSSPIAVERSVYEVIGGAYRKNNVTGLELRFNPMKRNRGGEQDLDHIIAAAVRGMDRGILEYPQVRAGLIFCLDRSFTPALNEIMAAKAISWHSRGVIGIDIAGPVTDGFRFADYADIFRECRRAGLGLTVHAGETGG